MNTNTVTGDTARRIILSGEPLPEGLSVGESLYLDGCTGLTALPEGLSVGWSLYLNGCTGLTALPEGLSVGGSLNLVDCTGLTALPEGLSVGGSLYLNGCTGLPALYTDPRGHELRRVVLADGAWLIAGCRRFRRAEALAHWGAFDYPDRARGDAFCAAIRTTTEE